MAVSASGLFTLLAIILMGPLYYGGLHLYRRAKGTVRETKAPEKDDEDRDIIDTHHYLFALIGYAIGIGNMWRFPYVVAQHGGGAALLAYIVCAILVACPLFLYEMIMGQHVRLSTIRCYNTVRPRWKGLGMASGLMLFVVLCYYGMVISYSLPYIWNSLKDPLPWIATGAENFWLENVLDAANSDNVKGLGACQGNLVASLFVFWLIVFMTVGFGRQVLAKITYVTVLVPVFLVVVLVLRTASLEGAGEGVKFYIGRFEVKYLWNARTWAAACGQALFSMSPGLGTVITYSSYAKPKEDVYRACVIVSLSNCVFSIVAAFATFSLVGHMALKEGQTVEELATRSGSGLAFITMAEAMQYFGSAANAVSVLFFSTLFLLGLDSAYAMEQTLTSYALDFWAQQGWKTQPRWKMSLLCCVGSALIGLIFTTRKGNSILEVLDHFIGSIALLVVAFLESIMLNWDFTYRRLQFALAKATYNNPRTPEGRRLGPKWLCKLDFHLTVPLFSGLLAGYLIILDMKEGYNGYPKSTLAWGWVLLILIFLISLSTLYKRDPSGLASFDDEDIKINDSETEKKNVAPAASEPEIQLSEVV
eukprot:scaffold1525_cov142-Cylindrotheca_fusiformis.AAC.170